MASLSRFRRLVIAAGLASPLLLLGTGAEAEVVARVNIATQQMTVFVDGIPRYDWPVSTARRGYVTPTGTFRPLRMHTMWRSRKYDNAPMPFSVFFHGGYAVHGTQHVRALGTPASHGCVRLATDNARTLYSLVNTEGMGNVSIVITR